MEEYSFKDGRNSNHPETHREKEDFEDQYSENMFEEREGKYKLKNFDKLNKGYQAENKDESY